MSASTGLVPISLATLQPTASSDWDLFVLPRGGKSPMLYCARSLPFAHQDMARLSASGVTKLFVRRDDCQRYQAYLRDNLDALLSGDRLTPTAKVATLNEVVRDVLNDSFRRGETSAIVDDAHTLGRRAAELLTSSRMLFTDLVRVLHHDFTTFTHSANVGFYAVMLARVVGIAENELASIGAAGLLHDIGKLEIDDRILTKTGRLEESESRQMRKHPTVGFRKLCRRDDLSAGQLMMVYQHHERLDGQGYPVGVSGDDIHPWAKLCTVVDVFDALTSQRPYREPMGHQEALDSMEKDNGTMYDREMFRCWKRLILTSGAR